MPVFFYLATTIFTSLYFRGLWLNFLIFKDVQYFLLSKKGKVSNVSLTCPCRVKSHTFIWKNPTCLTFHLQTFLFPAMSYSNYSIFQIYLMLMSSHISILFNFSNISDANVISYLPHPILITKSHEMHLMFRETKIAVIPKFVSMYDFANYTQPLNVVVVR